MKRFLLCLHVLLSVHIGCMAHDFEVDGIYYNKNADGASVTVTYRGSSQRHFTYSGEVNIPSSVEYDGNTYAVTALGDGAFYYCNVTKVHLPYGITTLGDGVFNGSSVYEVNIPSSVRIIGNTSFAHTQITSITIPEGVEVLGDNMFRASQLTNAILPSTLKKIGYAAFGEIPMTNIILPEGLEEIGNDAFHSATQLQEIVIPSTVKSIGVYAFAQCTNLTTLIFRAPSCLETIGNNAFYKTAVLDVEIPESVVSIGDEAFNGRPLETLTFRAPSKLEKIGDNAFVGASIRQLVIPNSVKEIGYQAFRFCKLLESVTLPETMTSIGASAFNSCTSLTSITFPEGIEEIADAMCAGNTSLKQVVIPSTVKKVGNYSFSGCALKTLQLPEGLKEIGEKVSGSSELMHVNIPSTVEKIGANAFYECKNLTIDLYSSIDSVGEYAFGTVSRINILDYDAWMKLVVKSRPFRRYNVNNNGLYFYGYHSNIQGGCSFPHVYLNNELVDHYIIPEGISKVETYTFYDNKDIVSVVLPNSLKILDAAAFKKCTSLKTITFGTAIDSIYYDAFVDCSNIENVDIGDLSNWCEIWFGTMKSNPLRTAQKVILKGKQLDELNIPTKTTKISNFAFYNCLRFDKVIIPASVTSIEMYAFANCADLETVTLKSGSKLTTLGANVFENCSGLTMIQLPNTVTSIGANAFQGCTGLQNINIPNKITSLEDRTFQNCKALQSIVLPEGIEKLGERVFEGCSSITWIDIPASVNEIYHYALAIKDLNVNITDLAKWCEGLNNGPCYGDGGFSLYLNGDLITNLVIPSGVKNIRKYAFNACKSITSITIPEGVTTIGWSAFRNCSNVNYISLPSSLTDIGEEAFSLRSSNVISLYLTDLTSFIKSNNNESAFSDKMTNLYVNGSLVRDLIIPEGITNIGRLCFAQFNINSVALPKTLESLYTNTFDKCSNLKYIYSKSKFAPDFAGVNSAYNKGIYIEGYGRPYNPNLKGIYVPKGKVNAYTNKWLGYNNPSIIKEAPDDMFLDGEQTAESIQEQKMAYSAVNGVPVTYVDLTEATLDETVTSGTLKERDTNTNTFYFLPSGTTGITGDNIVQDSHAENVVLENGSDMAVPMAFTADMVNLSCSFPASDTEAYTLCLPYSLSTLPEGMKAYTIKETNKNSDIVFAPVTSVEANKPYLITTSNDIDNLCMENVEFEATPEEMEDAGNEDFEFRGTLCDISNEDAADMGAYVLTANREWLPVSYDTPERYIKAGSAYLVPITSPKAKVLSLFATDQGEIESIPGDANGDSSIDVTDIVGIANKILGRASDSFVAAAADVNGDGEVDVTDIVAVANIILRGGKANSAKVREAFQMLDPQ